MKKSEISALIIAVDFTLNVCKSSPNTAAAFGVEKADLEALRNLRPKLKAAQLPGGEIKIPVWLDEMKPKNIARFDSEIPF